MTLQWQEIQPLVCNGLPMPGTYAPVFGRLAFKSMSIIAGKPVEYTWTVFAQGSSISTLSLGGHKISVDMLHFGKPLSPGQVAAPLRSSVVPTCLFASPQLK
jgi:hypothetical protein